MHFQYFFLRVQCGIHNSHEISRLGSPLFLNYVGPFWHTFLPNCLLLPLMDPLWKALIPKFILLPPCPGSLLPCIQYNVLTEHLPTIWASSYISGLHYFVVSWGNSWLFALFHNTLGIRMKHFHSQAFEAIHNMESLGLS